ncbi:hypothetical protein [Asticcacaulis benevestitus]|uniref:Uncharacterized protein n=1 Tax=Asticcacaulis benevestitus DSM 16100 = ATCC BAA-896 TaxID=1121022 RepID=V4PKJ2_9CAUL|nr:hypothetical protein [Asticcacaulis benevestitus]ESQ87769.1 hypothetical protein ABENE_17000 [Asticcacaulis benevestitus DSM 16100 = ATCC BAA-896]
MTETSRTLNLAILCISDGGDLDIERRAERLTDRVVKQGHRVLAQKTLSDDRAALIAQIRNWIDDTRMDVILVIDPSIFTDGETSSTIPFSDDPDSGLTYSLILTDDSAGFIGAIHVKAMRALPALM